MIVIGPSNMIHNESLLKGTWTIMNYISLLEGYHSVSSLIPSIPLEVDDDNFYEIYKNIISNDILAMNDIYDIMRFTYNGINVYLMIDTWLWDNNMDVLVLSLCEYIKERFGYTVNIIHDNEDIENLKESTFSKSGLEEMDSMMRMFGRMNYNDKTTSVEDIQYDAI